MARRPAIGIDPRTFQQLRRSYRRRWKVAFYATDTDGRIVLGDPSCKDRTGCARACRHAIHEALRWGEPTVAFCPRKRMIWAVPLMDNARLLGGLVASAAERQVFPDHSGSPAMDVRSACTLLRMLAEQANLTNAALLASRRDEYQRERQRAEAIHEFKLVPIANVREMYLRDEPALIAAIRKDDRPEARGILNRLLAAIYHQAGSRLDLIKSFLMELVSTMCRTAVEAGGDPEKLFGTNFASISELSRIESEERLAPWLHEMLERIMDAIRGGRRQSPSYLVTRALNHMAEHYAENISRDDVARAVHVSPSHLSRMIKRHISRSYTDLINQMRVDRAAELLARSDLPLSDIAGRAGFKDQSYFTKVFGHYMRLTPRKYRQARRPTA